MKLLTLCSLTYNVYFLKPGWIGTALGWIAEPRIETGAHLKRSREGSVGHLPYMLRPEDLWVTSRWQETSQPMPIGSIEWPAPLARLALEA
jgi:hypothetical protein